MPPTAEAGAQAAAVAHEEENPLDTVEPVLGSAIQEVILIDNK